MKLALGLPIGSLQQTTLQLMEKAGFKIWVEPRSYYPTCDDPELSVRLIRPQDMSRFVEKAAVDAGITGQDWVLENGSDVTVVTELVYAKQRLVPVRWVLAVPEDSPIRSVKDLNGKRIATELVEATKKYLAKNGIEAEVEFSHGATEAKAPDIVDAIVDVTETGSSLRANNMRIVETVVTSTTQLIANNEVWKDTWKRSKIEALAVLLQGAISAREKAGLKMNVSKESLQLVLGVLPAMRKPTISELSGGEGYAVESIVDEAVIRQLIPKLKQAGAEGIVEYPLNKVIP